MPEDASSNPTRANEFFVGRLQCQNNMKLVFGISEDGSEIVKKNRRGFDQKHEIAYLPSLLTDVVVLTPSDEILPSAYPSCIFDSLCFSRANHLAVFKNIRANWKPPYILRD